MHFHFQGTVPLGSMSYRVCASNVTKVPTEIKLKASTAPCVHQDTPHKAKDPPLEVTAASVSCCVS